jgi:hypothetical protein
MSAMSEKAVFSWNCYDFRNRNGFQMPAGWMRGRHPWHGRRLKALEEGNRGQRARAMEI